MSGDGVPLLRDYPWDVSYTHEDGDLVELFFVPALSGAKHYRRATGYFSGEALAMAARGLDKLIEAGGHMHLLVGCTLNQEDIEQIEKGYDACVACASRVNGASGIATPAARLPASTDRRVWVWCVMFVVPRRVTGSPRRTR